MKLFRRKRNNKGFTLVEVICAVAIMGLISTAIGSAMIITTRNYHRGNADIDVQKEAQATTNLIGNLIVDSVNVTTTTSGATTTVTVDSEGCTYDLVYDAGTDTITYKETLLGGTPISGTLAENVVDFRVSVDAENKNTKVELAMEVNGKKFEATYHTNSRNGQAINVGAADVASIILETDVTLEPNQEYDFPLTVFGMSADEAGLVWGPIEALTSDSEVGSTHFTTTSNTGATIHIDSEAKGDLFFTVQTVATDSSGLPLDTAVVTVRVRSVESVGCTLQLMSGTPGRKDAVYRVYADAIGYNLDKVYGKVFDNDYKDPSYMGFRFEMKDKDSGASYNSLDYLGNIQVFDDVPEPYFEFKLKENMPNNSVIRIYGCSKHAQGIYDGASGYNKTNTPYDTVEGYVELEAQHAVTNSTGLMRGDDYMLFETILVPNDIKMALGGNHDPHWYMRYREQGSTVWSPYYRTVENGSEPKFNTSETKLWEPNKGYEFQIILAVVDETNKKLLWPYDASLLTEPGFQNYYGPTFSAGWDPSETPMIVNQYGGTFDLPKSEMMFVDDPYSTLDNGLGLSSTEPSATVGSAGNGIDLSAYNQNGTPSSGYMNETLISFQVNNLAHLKHGYDAVIWKFNAATGNWDLLTTGEYSQYFNLQISNSQFRINNIKFSNKNDADPSNDLDVTGHYKMGIVVSDVGGVPYQYAATGSNLMGIVFGDLTTGPWPLYNEATGVGFVYFDIIEP